MGFCTNASNGMCTSYKNVTSVTDLQTFIPSSCQSLYDLYNDMQSFLKYKPSLLVAIPSEAGAQVECFSFNSNAPQLELSPVEYVAGPVSNHLVKNTIMVRVSGSVPLFLTTNANGNVMM